MRPSHDGDDEVDQGEVSWTEISYIDTQKTKKKGQKKGYQGI